MSQSSVALVGMSPLEAELRRIAAERILVLDGAMGTMIQALGLDEEGYRGARFDAWNREVRGNNDLLNLSQPDAVRDIHLAYFRAGADIAATNTFSSTAVAQADYGMADIAYELNHAGAQLVQIAFGVGLLHACHRANSPLRGRRRRRHGGDGLGRLLEINRDRLQVRSGGVRRRPRR